MSHSDPPFRILFICTGNICRSPMAAALVGRDASEAGLPVMVESAGLLRGGDPADEYAIEVMATRGLDISGHRSRRLDEVSPVDFDLLLGLTREHVRSVAVDFPSVYRRSFTLKEFVRRSSERGGAFDVATRTDLIHAVQEGREPSSHLGASPLDDVADPFGLPRSAFVRTADELSALGGLLVESLGRVER